MFVNVGRNTGVAKNVARRCARSGIDACLTAKRAKQFRRRSVSVDARSGWKRRGRGRDNGGACLRRCTLLGGNVVLQKAESKDGCHKSLLCPREHDGRAHRQRRSLRRHRTRLVRHFAHSLAPNDEALEQQTGAEVARPSEQVRDIKEEPCALVRGTQGRVPLQEGVV